MTSNALMAKTTTSPHSLIGAVVKFTNLNPPPNEAPRQYLTVPGHTVQMEFSDTDDKGRKFAEFYVRRDALSGPGWYIYGYAKGVSAKLTRLCGRPCYLPRFTPSRTAATRRGWRTKREATEALHALQRYLFE